MLGVDVGGYKIYIYIYIYILNIKNKMEFII